MNETIYIWLEFVRLRNQLAVMKNRMKAVDSLYAEEQLTEEQYMKALLATKLETEGHMKELEDLKNKVEAL